MLWPAKRPYTVNQKMASKADQTSAPSSKVFMLLKAKKSGFVIPKNKLSGSLVPAFKAAAKNGSNSATEESSKQSQRKTKFSSRFTPDSSVRKRTALAYQTRLDQINKRLKTSGECTEEEFGDYELSTSPTKAPSTESNKKELDKAYRELIDLERRDIISELLKLNPAYKAPLDYKPLLKEARIPVPTKEYSGYNFIRMLLGGENNTQKRLQDEIGARIRVQGTKKGTDEKREITQADINEVQTTYEDIFIDVIADTYDKVDAAVALLEPLLTSAASVPATPKPVSSAAPSAMTTPLSTFSQFSPNPSPWLPPRAPPAPLNSASVPSPSVQPLPTNSTFQYRPYTGQTPPVRTNPVLVPLSPAGPGPHRPLEPPPARQPSIPYPQVSSNSTLGAPYHSQMRGPPQPEGMHGAPPQSMGPLPTRAHMPPYTSMQPPRGPTPLAASNYPSVRPQPASGDFSYQPRQPFPPYHNPGNQFGYQRGPHEYDQPPARPHGFQYPNEQRPQMDPYGYPWAPRPGQMRPGQMMRDHGYEHNYDRNYDRNFDRTYDRPNGRGNFANWAYGAASGPRGSQYNDPPFKPSYGGPVRPRKERKGEADPEYEDLMASVGVK